MAFLNNSLFLESNHSMNCFQWFFSQYENKYYYGIQYKYVKVDTNLNFAIGSNVFTSTKILPLHPFKVNITTIWAEKVLAFEMNQMENRVLWKKLNFPYHCHHNIFQWACLRQTRPFRVHRKLSHPPFDQYVHGNNVDAAPPMEDEEE